MNEEELFERFRATRDPAPLAELFDRTAPHLLRLARHLAKDTAEAEDLVQTTFLTAIESASSWQRERGLFPWLVGILTNRARDARRRATRSFDPELLRKEAPRDPQREAEERELQAATEAAIEGLPEVYQPVLRLHLTHGLNAAEIAKALARPAGTVRTQLVRGLELLRKALPVGLGVTATLSASGLAAVRAAVLQNVGVTPVSAFAMLGGLLVIKKALVVCAVLAIGTALWWRWSPSASVESGVTPAQGAAPLVALAASVPSQPSATRQLVSQGGKDPEPASRAGSPAGQRLWLDGIVVDDAGKPVEGAELCLLPGIGGTWSDGRLVSTSDARGHFSVVAGDGEGAIAARKAGYAPSDTCHWRADTDTIARPHLGMRLVLTRACGALAGRVEDPSGAPVAEAMVMARFNGWVQRRDNAGFVVDNFPPSITTTDAEGRFRLEDLPLGTKHILVEQPSFLIESCLAEVVAGREPIPLPTITLRRGASVAGFVRDAQGTPVARAVVTVDRGHRAGDKTSTTTTRSADDGSYELAGLGFGEAHVTAEHGKVGRASRTVTLSDGQRETCDLVLRERPRIRGCIEDHQGRPLVRWFICAHEDRGDEGPGFGAQRGSAFSDERGEFSVERLEEGDYTLTADLLKAGRVYPPVILPHVRTGAAGVVLRVEDADLPSAFVLGRVCGADGAPVAGARLSLHRAGWKLSISPKSDTGGSFEIGPVPRGRYDVSVTAEGFLLLSVPAFDLASQERHELGVLRLERGGTIVVRLVAGDGSPWRASPPRSFQVNRNGEISWVAFTFEGNVGRSAALAPGECTLRVEHDDLVCAPLTLQVRAGAVTEAEMRLAIATTRAVHFVMPRDKSDASASLRVVVRDRSGAVFCEQKILQRQPLPSAPRGAEGFIFRAAYLPGFYELSAETDTGVRFAGTLTVRDLTLDPVPLVIEAVVR